MSDRILVMSDGPGRIVEEIEVGLPHRNNPIERMATQRASEIVAHLFDALHIENRLDA
jgi:NitT/TauT family transport system ATP-binding protein